MNTQPEMKLPPSSEVSSIPKGEHSVSMVQLASADEANAAQKRADKENAEANAAIESEEKLGSLEGYLKRIFDDAVLFKESETNTQDTMLDSLLRRNAQYTKSKLDSIRSVGSSEVFVGLTGVKCRAFESFVSDVYMSAKRKRTWTLKPTPVVTISQKDKDSIKEAVMAKFEKSKEQGEKEMTPEDAYEAASNMRADIIELEYSNALEKAENMSRLIHDQLIEGDWQKAMSDGVMDLSTMKAEIIKGPVFRNRTVKTGYKNGKPVFESKSVATFERVSPLDFYPSRHSQGVTGPPITEIVSLDRASLAANRDEDGYQKETIEKLISNKSFTPPQTPLQGKRSEAERSNLDNTNSTGSILRGVEFWCSCNGKDLISFGITKDADGKSIDIFLDYEISAITINNKIVFLEFNTDPLKRRPYSITGYTKEIGGFWYMGIPEIMKHPQDIINASARALTNNLGYCQGPQVIINDINKLAPGEEITTLEPMRIWQGTQGGATSGTKLIEFFQIDSRASEFISVIDKFTSIADSIVELPSYTYGSDKVAGAGRTSSGLSMLMSGSSRGAKRIILDMDRNIVRPVIEFMADWNAMNSTDESIKGDVNFYSEGVIALMMREQLSERRLGFLQATQNEFDMKIIGLDGRAKILSDAMEALESGYDDIIPSEEKIAKLIEQEEILQEQRIRENESKIQEKEALVQREAEVAAQEAELAMQKLELERRAQDLEFKTKGRELDIRASKQMNDEFTNMLDPSEGAPGAPEAPAAPGAKKEAPVEEPDN